MADYTPKQLRNVGRDALEGRVPPKNEPRSEDHQAAQAFFEREHQAAQAKINAAKPVLSQPGRRPAWGEQIGVAP
jgi:hypothetical protein